MFVKINKKWPASSWFLAIILVSPVLAIIWQSFGQDQAIFSHLWDTVLPSYLFNSISIVLGVIVVSTILGVPCAWLIANYDFPLRNVFMWAMLLPLAMPSYVVAYVYTDLFECVGPVQSWFKSLMDKPSNECFFVVRSHSGAVLALSLVLYPYIYLLARAAFAEQSNSLIKSARVMGCSAWQSFYRVSLPLARPAIVVAITLVAMETLADFAVVKYFAVSTLTTAVYDTWLGYGSLTAAARISVMLLLVIFALVAVEKFSRRQQKYYQPSTGQENVNRVKLTGASKVAALSFLGSVFALAFLLPFVVLLKFSIDYFSNSWNEDFFSYSFNSFFVAACTSVLCLLVGLILGYYKRLSTSADRQFVGKLASTGYALPGTVLAIGVLIPLTLLDKQLNWLFEWFGENGPGLLFSGSLFAIVFAYTVRFSAIAIGAIESSLSKVSPSLDMVSVTMGTSPLRTLVKVHTPLVQKGFFAAALLVFIESMKELPAALLVRPFGFETLATHVYQFVSDEQLERAALSAIVIVFVGLIPLIYLNRFFEQEH